jgi:hypothetical protein
MSQVKKNKNQRTSCYSSLGRKHRVFLLSRHLILTQCPQHLCSSLLPVSESLCPPESSPRSSLQTSELSCRGSTSPSSLAVWLLVSSTSVTGSAESLPACSPSLPWLPWATLSSPTTGELLPSESEALVLTMTDSAPPCCVFSCWPLSSSTLSSEWPSKYHLLINANVLYYSITRCFHFRAWRSCRSCMPP